MKTLLDMKINVEKNEFTISDNVLGTRTLGMDNYLQVIRDQFRYLKNLQVGGNKSAHLRRDIRVYKYILDSDNPEVAAEEYMRMANTMREESRSLSVEKMAVAKRLGWRV